MSNKITVPKQEFVVDGPETIHIEINIAPIDDTPPSGNDPPPPPSGGPVLPKEFIKTVKSGLASDPTVWENGSVPHASTNIIIEHNLNIDTLTSKEAHINSGITVLTNNSVWNTYGSIVVRSTLLGQQVNANIHFFVPDDTKFIGNVEPGPNIMMPDYHPEDIGLWTMPAGTTKLQGIKKTSWDYVTSAGDFNLVTEFQLSKNFQRGDKLDLSPLGTHTQSAIQNGQATLSNIPNNWWVGDNLLLLKLDGSEVIAKLLSIDGNNITFNNVTFDAPSLFWMNNDDVIEHIVSPIVVNLTRSIKIISTLAVEGDPNHRAHTIFMKGAHGHIDYCEVRNCGPRKKLGRYPLHRHHASAFHEDSFIGNSIWQDCKDPGNRFVVIHRSNDMIITDNVGYLSKGMGYFEEDGAEERNIYKRNISSKCIRFEDIPVKGLISYIDGTSAGFWLWDTAIAEDNVSHGCQNGIALQHRPETTDFSRQLKITRHVVMGTRDRYQPNVSYGLWTSARGILEDCVVVYSNHAFITTFPPVFRRSPLQRDVHITGCKFVLIGGGITTWGGFEHVVDNCLFLTEHLIVNLGRNCVGYVRNSTIKTAVVHGFSALPMQFHYIFENCNVEGFWSFAGRSAGNFAVNAFPSLIEFVNCSGQIAAADGESVTTLGTYTAYSSTNSDFNGFEGTDLPESVNTMSKSEVWKILDGKPPKAVFFELKPGFRAITVSITPVDKSEGQRAAGLHGIPFNGFFSMQNQIARYNLLFGKDVYENWFGYALPPGDYTFKFYDADDNVKNEQTITL